MTTATVEELRAGPATRRRRRSRRRLRLLVPAGLAAALATSLLAGVGGDQLRRPERATASSALIGDGVTVSPAPGAAYASPQTEISFLGISRAKLGAVTVVGSRSGRHRGRLVAYLATRGVSFVPTTPFAPDEQVTVRAPRARVSYRFRTSTPAAIEGDISPTPAPTAVSTDAATFASAPALHPPQISVLADRTGAAGGDVFLAPIGANGVHSDGDAAPMIIGSSGDLVWEGSLPAGDEAMDFQPQTYRGRAVLTWWQGQVSQYGFGLGEDVILDSSYHAVATVRAGNGGQADLHEFQITRRGMALITSYRPVVADLSAYGGSRQGVVLDSVVQEIDVATGRVVFEWNPLDHLSLSDSHTKPASTGPWDAIHVNSVDVSASGQLLIGARNTWAAYDVDPRTGEIAWELGGKRTSFRLAAADAFAWQHDIRFQPHGEVSVFDDEGSPRSAGESRALVLKLDRSSGRAVAVAQYAHTPGLLSPSQGNTDTLANGNVFVGWGAEPYYSEFSAAGALVYDARMPGPDVSYRAFRSPWTGHPTTRPSIAVRSARGSATVYASWNGATNVSRWEVLAGPSRDGLSVVASVARSGFETALKVNGRPRYFAVRAVSAKGAVLGSSSVEPG